MIVIRGKKAWSLVRIWVFILSVAAGGVCASVSASAQQTKAITAGQKAKVKGRITQRDAETFTVNESIGRSDRCLAD